MKIKIGDKVTVRFLPKDVSYWTKQLLGESGIIIRKCCVRDCFVVRVSKFRGVRHLNKNWISLINVKNQQLVFDFMD